MVDILGNINMNQNQARFQLVHQGTSFPVSPAPVDGQLFYRTDEHRLYFYNALVAGWKLVGSSTSLGVGRYVASFTGSTGITVTHNLGDLNPVVQVYDSNNEQITPDLIDVLNGNQVQVNFAVATSGWVVVQGGQGADIGTTAYYSQAFTSQITVNVAHGLGSKYVVVKCYNASDAEIEPESVTLTDTNNLVVTFGVSTSGMIVVCGGTTDIEILGVKRYSTTFSGVTTTIINHNLNTITPQVSVYDGSGIAIYPDITVLDLNRVQLDFASSTSGSVEVQGGTQSTSPGAGNADFLPDTDNAYDIGSGTYRWKAGHYVTMFLGVVASDPVSPLEGQIWYNSTDKQFKGYNGTGTIILG